MMDVFFPEQRKRRKWTMNGITYYYKNGMLCQCMSHRPRLRTGKKKNGKPLIPTPEQVKARVMFKQMNFLKRYFFSAQIKGIPIWDLAPGIAGQDRMAKFHRANAVACGERGVEYYSIFKFSEGILFPPINMHVERNGWMVTMTWENREERELSLASDWLRVGYFYDAYPFAPRLLPEIVAKRGDCQAVFRIPDSKLPVSMVLHLYPFFSRQDKYAFSTSCYFQV